MLTRSKSKLGEGALKILNLEIGKRKTSQKEAMESPKKDGDASKYPELSTKHSQELFLDLVRKVNELYDERKKGDGSGSSGKDDKGNKVYKSICSCLGRNSYLLVSLFTHKKLY